MSNSTPGQQACPALVTCFERAQAYNCQSKFRKSWEDSYHLHWYNMFYTICYMKVYLCLKIKS